MTTKALTFNKTGYDPFIDFLKAYCIVCVVIAHNFPVSLWKYCLFQIWGDMQVPLFILIQVFHAFKKEDGPRIKWQALFRRIVVPFVIIQFIILIYRLVFTADSTRNILISSLLGGGVRPRVILFLGLLTDCNYPSADMAYY